MAEKLSDVIKRMSEKPDGSFKSVLCPSCAAQIWLYEKMEYGYCPACAGRISLKKAENREFSRKLLESLSGDEYYALMQQEDGEASEEVLQKAAEKGSVKAAMDLGSWHLEEHNFKRAEYYYQIAAKRGHRDAYIKLGDTYAAQQDFQQAMHYYEIAEKEGCDEAREMCMLMKYMIEILQSGDSISVSRCRAMDAELNGIRRQNLSESHKDAFDVLRNWLKSMIRKQEPRVESTSRESAGQRTVIGRSHTPAAPAVSERTFTQGGPTGCGIGGSFCGCGAGR